jgi:hypothetical protein
MNILSTTNQHHSQKRDDGIGYSGYKHQKGEKIIAMTDNHGDVLSPRFCRKFAFSRVWESVSH